MGRASRAEAERNHAHIVATANRLFRERGVENVSIAEVMAASGLTTGGFYKKFASKDALVAEALEFAFGQAVASWQQAPGNAADRLSGLVSHYFQPRPPERTCPMLAFCNSTAVSGAPATVEAYAAGVADLLEAFEQTADQSVSDDEPLVLFAAMVGAGMLARAAGPTPQIRGIQDAVLAAAGRYSSDHQEPAETLNSAQS